MGKFRSYCLLQKCTVVLKEAYSNSRGKYCYLPCGTGPGRGIVLARCDLAAVWLSLEGV